MSEFKSTVPVPFMEPDPARVMPFASIVISEPATEPVILASPSESISTVPPCIEPVIFVPAEESIDTDVVPVMSFALTPAPAIETFVPVTVPVISASPAAVISIFPPFIVPAAVSAPEESISTKFVPVTVLCAPRFTLFASRSISSPESEPVTSAEEFEAFIVSFLSALREPETFMPVFCTFTVVVPPEIAPAIFVVPEVLVMFKPAVFLISAPCSTVIPLLPELDMLRFIPLRSPETVFLNVIPPFAASFLIFIPGTGALLPPRIGPLSPPRSPAITIEPFPLLFSIFISA